MGWDDYVQFTGYWETGDRLKVIGRARRKSYAPSIIAPPALPPVVVANGAAYDPAAAFSTFYTADRCRTNLKATAQTKKAGSF